MAERWLLRAIPKRMYVEQAAGTPGLEEAVKDMSVGALAYDTVPLSSASKLDMFSPEFQSLVTDKGAMILHMLRWVMGEEKYYKTMRTFATQFAGKSASIAMISRPSRRKNYGDKLTWFFSQWLDSTGAPEFKTKYTIYRLGNNKGFRVVGEISQDLDLFRMPVDLKIDTDGKTEEKRIEVVGTNSPFTLETFGKPRRIVGRSRRPGSEEFQRSASCAPPSCAARRWCSRATWRARCWSSTRRST